MESKKATEVRIYLFLLGVIAMSTQVILLREVLAIFHGNELILGLFLGIWMLLTAAGSLLAVRLQQCSLYIERCTFFQSTIDNRQSTIENPSSFFLLFSVSLLPLATLFLLVTLRYFFVPSGVMPGLGMTALVIILALLPFCIVSGMLFPLFVQNLSVLKNKNLLSQGYALESLGSILGGLLFSLVFILVLPPYESLVLLSSFSLLLMSLLSFITRQFTRAISMIVLAIVVFSLPAFPGLATYLDRLQFHKQNVIEIRSSPVGMIAVSKMDSEVFIYENGIPVSMGSDVILREESVHYAMLLHPSPGNVLIISGAANGSIEEALKYPGSSIDYIDRDPWLLKVIDNYRPLPQDPRVNYYYEDARRVLSKSDQKYDVILVNTSVPESAEMNRYYTVEFYELLKKKLNPGGIISVSTPAAGNYMNETSRHVHSVIYNTLKEVFSQIRIIPGAKDYFIASDSTIELSIFKDFQKKGIQNDYVNPFYINENLLNSRSDLIMKDIETGATINSDLKPFVFSLFLKQWLERFKINTWIIPLILILLLVLSLVFLGPLNLGLFTGGFTASGLEFLLLIWFQVVYGNVYQMTGVIFAMFMAGIVFGSLFLGKSDKKHIFRGFLKIQGTFAIFSAYISILILLFPSSPFPRFPASMLVMILILVLITGILMGAQFALSARLRTTSVIKSSGESFSADLLGSAIGVVLVSVYLIPMIGLPLTAMSLAGLNLIAIATIAYKNQS